MLEPSQNDVKQSLEAFQDKLEKIFALANCQNEQDALFVVLHVLMLDMDFIPSTCAFEERFEKYPCDSQNSNGVHTTEYTHLHFPEVLCQMIAVPLGRSMVIHGTISNEDRNRAISLDVQGHVKFKPNTQVRDIYRHILQLALNFKDGFIIPLLSDIYEISGIRPAFALKNLSPDLKMNVFSYLPVESLLAISEVNKEFNELANFGLLWKHLYRRDFPDAVPESTDKEHDWKALYREEYGRQKREKAKRLAQSNSRLVTFGVDPFRMIPPVPFIPERNPLFIPTLHPTVQEAFPHLRDRYRVDNPIIRQMLSRNPRSYPYPFDYFM